MPIYTLKNVESGEIEEHFVSIAKMEEMVATGEWENKILTAPGDLGHTDGMLSMCDDSFKDILKTIKKNSGKSNTIKV